ncbi:Esa1p-associated factor [Coemansia thaxteri]|uniref:Chromatin modification-related protein EAF3 n=1 Tax=Coemansia thaxteri TaxID=2663907 RepID=A0A9W8EJ55_9FUNG|nr:Esa1p-associated factor [Coemansia thaxteri]KAJ2006033.1 Esa1p-associated factor [Coemansia thaxteri]KAJ2465467.1 Esa1p-associated factor [Coemansia sp. RSA 2322]KAJ2486099.1 Esa1p-associated factor [Coemansia sp. RSA 2320]
MAEKSAAGNGISATTLPFRPNERILCFHGPLLYEAKVVKAEMWDGTDPDTPEPGPHYFVHYKGWKQTWDEWVDESRALKFNDENLSKQKALKQAALQASKKKTIVVAAKHAAPSTPTHRADSESELQRGRKRARESSVEKTREECDDPSSLAAAQAFMSTTKGPDVKLPIPNALKAQLVDDWERITKDKLLVSLPRKPTITELLEQYKEYRRSAKDRRRPGRRDEEVADEIIEGLKMYFDKALGNVLLYRFERYQYQQIRERFPDKPPSDIYGAEHLLRLFVQMPGLIAHTNMDDDAVQLLRENLGEILKYMHRFTKTLFAEEYDNASPAYVAIAKAA